MGLHERARGVKGDTSVCLQHDLQGLPGALFALCGVDRLSLGVLGLWKRIWLALSPFRTGGVERPGVRPCGRERSAARAKAAQGTSNGDGEYRRQGEKTWNATRDRDTTSGGPSPRRWGFLKLQSPRASRWNSPHLSHSTAQTRAGRGRHGPFPPHALSNRQGAAQRAGLGAGTAEPRRRRLYAPEDQTLRLRIRQVRGAPGNLCAPQAPDGWAPQLPEPRLARVPKISPAGPGPRCAPRPPPPPHRATDCPSAGLAGRGLGTAASLSSVSLRRAGGPPASSGPCPGRGAAGEAGAGRTAEAALRAARRVQGAPPLSSFPGSSAGAVCGAGAHKGLRRLRPHGPSRWGRPNSRAARCSGQVSGAPGCNLGRGRAFGVPV